MGVLASNLGPRAGFLRFFTKTLGRSACVLFSIITLITVSCAIYNYHLFTKEKIVARSWAEKERRATQLTMALVALQKQAEIDAIRVEQAFADAGGPKGGANSQDALSRARQSSEKLTRDIEVAVNAADSLQNPALVNAFSEVRSRFPQYYEAGQEMARAYLDQESDAGAAAARFDELARELNQAIVASKNALDAEIEKNIDCPMTRTPASTNCANTARVSL